MPRALLALAIGAFGIGTTEFVVMGMLPEIADGLGVSVSAVGLLISAYAIGVVVGAPTLTALGLRFTPRQTLVALMVVFVVGNAARRAAPPATARSPRPGCSPPWRTAPSSASARSPPAGWSPPERATQAISLMVTGLTLANVDRRPARHVRRPAGELAAGARPPSPASAWSPSPACWPGCPADAR